MIKGADCKGIACILIWFLYGNRIPDADAIFLCKSIGNADGIRAVIVRQTEIGTVVGNTVNHDIFAVFSGDHAFQGRHAKLLSRWIGSIHGRGHKLL